MFFVSAFTFPMFVVYRLIQLGPFLLPGGTIFFAVSYVVGDIIAEVYGFRFARQLLWGALLCQFILWLFITLVLHLPHPSFWHHGAAFSLVLGKDWRYVLASTMGNFVGELANIYCLYHFKRLLKGRYFWLRSFTSSFIAEAGVTFIGYPIIFYHIVSQHQLTQLIFSGYLYKMLVIVVGVFPATMIVKYLRKKECLPAGCVFNPFKPGK